MIKITITSILFCLFISLSSEAQEMSFEEYNPKSTLVVSQNPVSKAKFRFIDVHSHQFRMESQDLSELINDMDDINMGIMVNLSGGSGKGLGPS